MHLLDFVQKSFGFYRLVQLEDEEFAVFERTETESESKFRPKLVRLYVLVPRAWLVHDFASDLLAVAPDGKTPGRKSSGSAVETAAEKTSFQEQGVEWRRASVPSVGLVYVPADRSRRLLESPGLEALRAALAPA